MIVVFRYMWMHMLHNLDQVQVRLLQILSCCYKHIKLEYLI